MMPYLEFSDNIPLPPELEQLALSVIGTTPDFQEVYAGERSETFQCYVLPAEVREWIKLNFPITVGLEDDDFKIHLIWKDLKIHSDYGRARALNYVIDTGGQNVRTEWYADDRTTVLFSEVIPPRTWHTIDTETLHHIDNIDHGKPRIGITVTTVKRKMADKIKIY